MSASTSAKGSPTQGDSQATSFNAPGAQPDLAEIQAQQLAQAGSIADLDEKFTTNMHPLSKSPQLSRDFDVRLRFTNDCTVTTESTAAFTKQAIS